MQALLAQGEIDPTHSRLEEVSFVPTRTISKVLKEARPAGLLVGGHPAHFGPGLGLVLGVSLGTESLRAALIDCNGMLHCMREAPRDPMQLAAAPRVLLSRIRSLVIEVLDAGLAHEDLRVPGEKSLHLLGLSVAWPLPVDRAKRVRGKALRDGTWRRRDPKTRKSKPLPEFLSESLAPPFLTERCHSLNDASAAALGVAFRKSRRRATESGKDNQWRVGLVIRMGGTLGAGTVLMAPHSPDRLSFIDSLLVEGTNGLGGALGHLPIGRRFIEDLNEACEVEDLAEIDYDRWKCSCGRRRHLDAFASGSAVVRRLKASGYDIPAEREGVANLLGEITGDEPDEGVVHALTDIGRILGRALTGPILMLDPYSITITGSLACEQVVEGMRRERDKWANAIDDKVQIGYLDENDAPYISVLGAGLAVIRRLVYRNYLDKRGKSLETFKFGARDLSRLRKRV